MTTLHVRKSIARQPLRLAFFLIPLALACFALSPQARAVCQEGCETQGLANTVLGWDALAVNRTGAQNTAIGFRALYSLTTGSRNTAIGSDALVSNVTGSENTATGVEALSQNSSGSFNTATGSQALVNNTNRQQKYGQRR